MENRVRPLEILFVALVCAVGALAYEFRFGYDFVTFEPPPQESIEREPIDGERPVPCVGYNPQNHWWGSQTDICPRNYAYMVGHDSAGPNKDGPAEFAPMIGICCRLPLDDILTDEHYEGVLERCPDGSIVTGGSLHCTTRCSMRCTKINGEKYQLGEETQSLYWIRRGAGHKFGRGSARKIYWDQIPVSIRYAAARQHHAKLGQDGCVPYPFGSIIVRKAGKRCDGLFARELQYRDGTPVKMLPKCSQLSDTFDPEAACIP